MTDCSSFRVEAVPHSGQFELIEYLNGKRGKVLLTTESVSVQTLVNICVEHKEGRA